MSRIQRLGLLLLILLPAFWLRLYQLDGQSLWWDEGISLHLATSTFAEIVANRVTNIHPPLYFFLLKKWVALTGTTPFAARYFSVLGSFIQIPLVYAVLRRWLGRLTAVIGLVLISSWAMFIVYGQEVRVYAFLPVAYLLLLFLTRKIVLGTAVPQTKTWLALGMVEWIALHLHYNVLFMLVFLNGWAVWQLWLQRVENRPKLWRWLKVQTAVGLASLPWAVAVLLNRLAGKAEANLADFSTEPPDWSYIIPQVWGFHLTGLVNVFANPWVQAASVALLLLVGLLLLWLWREKGGQWTGFLLLTWLMPMFLGFFMWLIRSFSHPRYVSMFAVGFILLLAVLLTPRLRAQRSWISMGNFLRMITAVLFFWLTGWGMYHYVTDPAFAKDDMREVAKILATASASDVILVPQTDWSLQFVYEGDTPIFMPNTYRQEMMWPELADWTMPSRYVFTLDYTDNFYDWQNVVPFALESSGNLVDRWQVDDLILSQYRLQDPLSKPQLVPRDGRFGQMAFLGSWVAPTAPAANGVTVALRWQLLAPVTHNYALVLSMDDGTGLQLAYTDDQLVTPDGRLTHDWDAGEVVTTYHFLPFVEGTPPVNYQLKLRVYIFEGEAQTFDYIDGHGTPQGQDFVVGEVQVERPSPGQESVYGAEMPYLPLPQPLQLAEGLQLSHALLDRSAAAPGQTVRVRLAWHSSAILPDLRPRIVLRQAGQELVSNNAAPVHGQYPTSSWQPDEFVWEQRLLTVPATAEPGLAAVFVELGERSYQLGELEISAEVRMVEPPTSQVAVDAVFGEVARLVGFDPPAESVPAGQPIPLTLYWQSLQTGEPVGYTVFAQVLAENGSVIAQHDSVPGNGRRPTTGWVEGEYIRDEHLLTFREEGYAGETQIIVGLYDPATGTRLTLPDGRDALLLPVPLEIMRE